MTRYILAIIALLAATIAFASDRVLSSSEADRFAEAEIHAQDTGICNIHHIRMRKKLVPIHWGLVVVEQPYYSAELDRFPNAREYVNGGCEYDAKMDRTKHFRYVCPECQCAQLQWALGHRNDPEAQSILKQRKT